MLSKRYSASSVTESVDATSLFEVSLVVTPEVSEVLVTVISSGGGGGDTTPGVSMLPAKAVKEIANVSTVAKQSCLSFLILNLLSIVSKGLSWW
jgi:hypothetical protein